MPGVNDYRFEGKLAFPDLSVAHYKATAQREGIVMATISSTTDNPNVDGYGSCACRILLNGKRVAASSGAWSGNVSDKRTFGASAAANLVVHAGDEIGLYCENSADHASYTATVISTAGELNFVKT